MIVKGRAHIHKPPRANAIQNHVLVLKSFQETRPVRAMNISMKMTAAGIEGV
jgi:hypothetical protein